MDEPKVVTVAEVLLWQTATKCTDHPDAYVAFDRLLATAQAAAEADSLRAQLEEARKEPARIMEIGKQFEKDCRATFAQSCDNLHRAEKAEAALTAAQGEVARLTGELEEARKEIAAGVRGLQDLASMVGPREAGWSDVWSSVELLKRERDAAQGEVAVLREVLRWSLRRLNDHHHDDHDPKCKCPGCASLASTRASADTHDERVRREALEDFATKLLTTSALPELHAGHTDAARWARALAHPTKGPSTDTKEKPK